MMKTTYIKRSIEHILKRAAKEFPAVVLTGPRQSGKTTVLKNLFAGTHRYVSLELPDIRSIALHDPHGFLDTYPPPVIYDEMQYVPELLPYIKNRIDSKRNTTGQFLLTGSQNILLMQRVTESLAGRAAMLKLLPFSMREACGSPHTPLPWESVAPGPHSKKSMPHNNLWNNFIRGFYPELVANPGRDIFLWHAGYAQTYLERDIRTLRHVGDLTQFQIFMRALAARSAQLLSLSDLARDLGIAVNTVKAWLSVLEATYQIIIIRPYFANIGKRLVKTPKVYFMDVGTLCYLVGLKDPEHAARGPLSGAIFETAVLSEIAKRYIHKGIDPQLYFWRTATGTEVDIVIEDGGQLVPVEIKHSSTPQPAMASAIKTFQKDFGKNTAAGYIIHTGKNRLPLGAGITALPFAEM